MRKAISGAASLASLLASLNLAACQSFSVEGMPVQPAQGKNGVLCGDAALACALGGVFLITGIALASSSYHHDGGGGGGAGGGGGGY